MKLWACLPLFVWRVVSFSHTDDQSGIPFARCSACTVCTVHTYLALKVMLLCRILGATTLTHIALVPSGIARL